MRIGEIIPALLKQREDEKLFYKKRHTSIAKCLKIDLVCFLQTCSI
jgi:hypothetical protein